MISQNLHNAINAQVNAELWSAYLYLAMSLDAEAKGYKGVANWFYVQFQEEQAHARIFMNYLNSRDAKVELLPIEAILRLGIPYRICSDRHWNTRRR